MNKFYTDDLGNLANPKEYTYDLDIQGHDAEQLISSLEKMILIRAVEEKIAELVNNGEVKCPCHLSVGQEAVAVGIAKNLTSYDRAFGNHRSHSHYLAMGGGVEELFCEIFGKETGCSKGMGGSMHLYAADVGFHGSVPIVAGTIPIAVGAALSAKLSGKDVVSIAFFGDGACEEGVFHESLNFASVMNLPVIFVVENNLYSSHMDIYLRQPSNSTARFAAAHNIQYKVVDGNDVISVDEAAAELIGRARRGDGPGFLEAVTFRWLGHVGGNHDVDVGVLRSIAELDNWKKRDPINRLFKALERKNIYTKDAFDRCVRQIELAIQEIVEKANSDDYPDTQRIINYVYSSRV